MHRVRAALVSGGASAYRLVARKSGQSARRRGGDAEEPSLDPAIVARGNPNRLSRQERDSVLSELRDESVPEDGSLAHWVTNLEGDQPLLPKHGRPAAADGEAEDEPSLIGEMIPRRESRTADSRREDRVAAKVDTAVLTFRDQDYVVRVVNTSSRGLQVESDLKAHIAEELSIRLDGGAATPCFVRWIRGGRIGLGFRENDLKG